MRSIRLASIVAVLLLFAPIAHAGPTCQTQAGQTTRCGTPGAMPVGWTLPVEQRASQPNTGWPQPAMLFGLVCVIGGIFALIALMPEFDGWRDGDWDRQEGDDEVS